ncbi:MAG: DUF2868 domain-containing protein [Desulfocapsaceae bacterium]|nr:DUF2868 domain-containing protein [Desulfocapsaceae bacterium]
MKPLWRISDLIDFEYLLLRDDLLMEENGQDALKRRDREIYLQEIAPEAERQGELTLPFLLHKWLKVRQQQEAEQTDGIVLPGRVWNELYKISCLLILLLGLTSGSGLAFSFLGYSGTEPVNVSMYLAIFVGVQILLIALLAAAFLYRLLWRLDLRSSVLYSLLSGLMVRGMLRLNGYIGNKLTGQQRLQMSAVQGLVRKKLQTHGSCFLLPIFTLLQVLAIGFNSGVLGATLLKVISADIAFGWQSTLQVSQQFVFTLVKALALPWSWFIPGDIAHPSLAHIAGSQMILKEGIYHLTTEALVSWWPFLCLAVLFYGLLPRMVLLFVGLSSQRRCMARLQFKGAACGQLLRRMTTPQVSSQAPRPDRSAQPLAQGLPQSAESAEARVVGPDAQGGLHTAIALIPDELHEQCPLHTLQALLQKRLGVTVQETLRTGVACQDEQVVLDQIKERNSTSKTENIVILQEAWQPPIAEFLYFLKGLRASVGADVPLIVALVGKPASDTIFTEIKEEDMKIWHQKVMAMGDADIEVVELVAAS